MPRRFRLAVLGGTFDHLHAGHERLIARAFEVADGVGIGVTTEVFLRAHPKPLGARIRTYRARRTALKEYLERTYPRRRFWLAPLNNAWGRSVEPGAQALIATRDTVRGARSVNAERRRRGLPPLTIVVVPLVRARDHRPISSRRIRAGEIDVRGAVGVAHAGRGR
ncbi:MAG: pantetheine-phosphate adenylyltransferase [Thermoplasmata archaeon]|nr:pantetheine-phosphate adenylyltransferase [Thermoplasmata archaeon]